MTRNTPVLLVSLLLCIVSLDAWAGRPVRVYEVELKGGQSPASVQDAMREALVRATGRRESATDPALASIISDAGTYVKGYTSPSKSQPQVIFDSAAVERAIVAAGRSTWDPVRPFTLVILYPALPRPADEAARAELDQAAIARGLPITVVPLSPVDASGNELPRDALMQMAQRYGGDAVLVGRSDSGTANGQLKWTLATNFSSASWSGPLNAGINGAVDNMAPAQGGSLSEIESSARVEISGVATLTDYVNVQRLLESAPGVRRVNVGAASGNVVMFDVLARGGGDAISHGLTGSSHLVQQEASSARLAYQYRP
ncbi:MAG: DUF2066 domain-containing protein [Proteobacteria bacterium]|nr:DUF2066 domain-containing protein [Pseudomonadota bacterium]